MKIFILFVLFILGAVKKCEDGRDKIDLSCSELFHTIFNEPHFFEANYFGINLVGIDTITILDKKRYFEPFNCKEIISVAIDTNLLNKGVNYPDTMFNYLIRKIQHKKVKILQEDNLSTSIRRFSPTNEEIESMKYRCYFLLTEVRVNRDTLYFHLDKLITNHSVMLTYVKSKKGWFLHEALIGNNQ